MSRKKFQFYILSLVTLIVFPAIGYGLLWFFEDITFNDFIELLELNRIQDAINLIGLEFGVIYAFFVLFVSLAPVFKELALPQAEVLKKLNLNIFDALFVSFCAGFGEEILFRVALQTWFGPWLTTIIFIAVHGYFSPISLKKNLLGITVLPFILIISFGYIEYGFWFAVAAHFAYDLVMFLGVIYSDDETLDYKTS